MADKKEFHAVPPQSHAAEFLANERTFLAWIRTSIAVVSFGFAIINFDAWTRQMLVGSGIAPPSTHLAGPVGGVMVVLGGLMSAVGAVHYKRTNRQIIEGQVQASNWLVLSISASVVPLSIAVIIYLVLWGEY